MPGVAARRHARAADRHRDAARQRVRRRRGANAALDAFAGRRDVTVGGSAVASMQVGGTVGADLGRAELIAFPILLVLSLLFFRGRAARPAARGRDDDGARHVPGAHGRQRRLRAQRLRAQPRDRASASGWRSTTRCSSSRASARSSPPARRPPDAIRTTMQHGRPDGRLLGGDRRLRADHATIFPQGFLKSMGIAGATVAIVAAVAALVVSPGAVRHLGRQARAPPRERESRARAGTPSPTPSCGARAPIAVVTAARHARRRAAVAEHAVVAGRRLRHPEGQERAHRLRRARARLRRRAPRRRCSSPSSAAERAAEVDAYARRIARLAGVARVAPPRRLGRDARGRSTSPRPATRPARRPSASCARSARCRPRWTSASAATPPSSSTSRRPSASRLIPRGRAAVRADRSLMLWLMTGSVVLPLKAVVDERADRRRGARPADADLPARAPERAARLHAQRRRRADRLPRHRLGRVRALHRLRRVPARAHQESCGTPACPTARPWRAGSRAPAAS